MHHSVLYELITKLSCWRMRSPTSACLVHSHALVPCLVHSHALICTLLGELSCARRLRFALAYIATQLEQWRTMERNCRK